MTQQTRSNHFGPITHTVITAQLACGHQQRITAQRPRPLSKAPTPASNAKLLHKVVSKTTQCRTCHAPSRVTDARILVHGIRQGTDIVPVSVAIPVHYTRNPGRREPKYTGTISAPATETMLVEHADSKEELEAKLVRSVLTTLARHPLHLPTPPQQWRGAIEIEVPHSLLNRLVLNPDELSEAPPAEIPTRTNDTME